MRGREFLFVLLVFSTLAMSFEPDAGTPAQSAVIESPEQDDYIITLTPGNSFQITYMSEIRCIDFVDGYNDLLLTSYTDDQMVICSADDGTSVGAVLTDPACVNPIGVCWAPISGTNYFWVNDWNWSATTDMYEFMNTTQLWTSGTNPAGGSGRGMDYDASSGYIWQVFVSPPALYRHLPDGSSLTTYSLSEVSGNICGLTIFPYGSGHGVMVSGYTDPDIHFYEFTGSTLSYLGCAAVPDGAATSSYGLAYSEDRASWWYSYRKNTSEYWIMEFDVDIQVSLDRASWGAIKASF